MRGLLFAFLILFSTSALAGFSNDQKLPDAKQEERAQSFFREIRCLVCDGESLAESNAELAGDMRVLIREKIANGETDDEIREYLVFRYGDGILQKPPFKPNTYMLWLTPIGLLAIGAIFVLSNIKLKLKKKKKTNGRRKLK